MATVKFITAEYANKFQKEIAKAIENRSRDSFTIQYTAQESYPKGKNSDTGTEFERLYTAMIIFD